MTAAWRPKRGDRVLYLGGVREPFVGAHNGASVGRTGVVFWVNAAVGPGGPRPVHVNVVWDGDQHSTAPIPLIALAPLHEKPTRLRRVAGRTPKRKRFTHIP